MAIFIYDLRASGVVRNAIRIAEAAHRDGLDTEIWVVRNEGELRSTISADIGVRTVRNGPPPRLRSRLLDSMSAGPDLTALLDRLPPRILFSAGNHAHALSGAAWNRSINRHSIRLVCRASNAPVRFPWLPIDTRGIERRLLERDYARADAIIAVSDELAADLQRSLPAPERIRVVRNGVNHRKIAELASEPLEDPWFDKGQPPVFVSVGRLSWQKGFDTLIDAFAIAAAVVPMRLVIVGPGKARARRKLQRRAAWHGVADRVRLIGYQRNPIRYMARAKAVVICSRWEGSSNVLLEAVASGAPVIATDCPTGIREVLTGHDLAPVGDAREIAERLVAHAVGADRLRPRMPSLPALEKTVADYVHILRGMIDAAQPSLLPDNVGAPGNNVVPISKARAGQWTAIVLAGQRPGADPVAVAGGVTFKALAKVAGEPMLAHVARALIQSPSIGRVVILAQEPERMLDGELAWLGSDPRISLAVSGAGIARSVARTVDVATGWPTLVTTADNPLLTPEIIEEFIRGSAETDLAVGFVERRAMLARYPQVRRTWLTFRGGAYSGANLFALRTPKVRPALELWEKAEADRKRAFRLLLHFGPALAVRVLTRSIELGAGIGLAGKRLGLSARPVVLSAPEAGIDVDKPHDLMLADLILQQRVRNEPLRWTVADLAAE